MARTSIKNMRIEKRLFCAEMDLMKDMLPVVDALLAVKIKAEKISTKYDIQYGELSKFIQKKLVLFTKEEPYTVDEDTDEEEVEDDEGEDGEDDTGDETDDDDK